MKEDVYHLSEEKEYYVIPAERSVDGKPYVSETVALEHFYLPERGLDFVTFPEDFPEHMYVFDKSAENGLELFIKLDKETLSLPAIDWEVIPLTNVPESATLFEVEKEEIEELMEVYEELQKKSKEFLEKVKTKIKFTYKGPQILKIDSYPEELEFKFYRLCEKIFLPLIQNKLDERKEFKYR